MDFGRHVSIKTLAEAVTRVLASCGVCGELTVVDAVEGRYRVYTLRLPDRGPVSFHQPLGNRSNSTMREMADDAAEHLLEILTRPEVAA